MLLVGYLFSSRLYSLRPDTSYFIAVAAHLAVYNFHLKTTPPSRFNPNNTESLPEKLTFRPIRSTINAEELNRWDEGVVYAYAQNLARTVRC